MPEINSVDDFINSQLSEAEFEQALIEGEAAYQAALGDNNNSPLPSTNSSSSVLLSPVQFWFL